MITKKDIPFDLLKAIEPLAQLNLDIIQLKREDNTYYSFVEIDNTSKNYFKILIDGSKHIAGYERLKFTFAFKPNNASSSKGNVLQASIEEVQSYFHDWLKLVREIHETPSIHDDNFSKKYSDFYFNEFKIIDEDSNISPFDPDQQELIEAYLSSLYNSIEQTNEQLPESIKTELLSEIKQIKTSLASSTKTQVMKKITKVFGKLYQTSKSVGKEVVTEAKKYLIKKLFDLGIEYGPKLLDMLSNQ